MIILYIYWNMVKAELRKKIYSESLKLVKLPKFDTTEISDRENEFIELCKREMMIEAISLIKKYCIETSNDEITFKNIEKLDEKAQAILNLEILNMQNELCRRLLESIKFGCKMANQNGQIKKYYLKNEKVAYSILDTVTTQLKNTYDEIIKSHDFPLESDFFQISKNVDALSEIPKQQITSLNTHIPQVAYDPIATFDPKPLLLGTALSIAIGAICVATGGIGLIIVGVGLLGLGAVGAYGAAREMYKKMKYFDKIDESYLAEKKLENDYANNYHNMYGHTAKLKNEIDKQSVAFKKSHEYKRGMSHMQQLLKETDKTEHAKKTKRYETTESIDDSISIKNSSGIEDDEYENEHGSSIRHT